MIYALRLASQPARDLSSFSPDFPPPPLCFHDCRSWHWLDPVRRVRSAMRRTGLVSERRTRRVELIAFREAARRSRRRRTYLWVASACSHRAVWHVERNKRPGPTTDSRGAHVLPVGTVLASGWDRLIGLPRWPEPTEVVCRALRRTAVDYFVTQVVTGLMNAA